MSNTTVVPTLSNVVKAVDRLANLTAQEQAIGVSVRTEFVTTAVMIHSAINNGVTGKDIAQSLSKETRRTLGFSTQSMVTYYAATGSILALEGDLPQDLTDPRELLTMVKVVGAKAVKDIVAKHSADQAAAVKALRAAYRAAKSDKATGGEDKAPKSAADLLNATVGVVGKAAEMGFDADAATVAESIIATLTAAIAASKAGASVQAAA